MASAWAPECLLACGETGGDRTDPPSLSPRPQLPEGLQRPVPPPVSQQWFQRAAVHSLPSHIFLCCWLRERLHQGDVRGLHPEQAHGSAPGWLILHLLGLGSATETPAQLRAETTFSDSPEGTDCHQPRGHTQTPAPRALQEQCALHDNEEQNHKPCAMHTQVFLTLLPPLPALLIHYPPSLSLSHHTLCLGFISFSAQPGTVLARPMPSPHIHWLSSPLHLGHALSSPSHLFPAFVSIPQ